MIDPPCKNWPQAFHKRHPELESKKVKALDWNPHDNNVFDKIAHWFAVIGKEFKRLLFKQNNEARSRQSTRSTVVGKAKVMSYEDIVEAQGKRAAKEAAKEAAEATGKRGRKRRSLASVAAKTKKARRGEVGVAKDEIGAGGMGNYCSVLQLRSRSV